MDLNKNIIKVDNFSDEDKKTYFIEGTPMDNSTENISTLNFERDEKYKRLCDSEKEKISKIENISNMTTLENDERFSTLSEERKKVIKNFSDRQQKEAKMFIENEIKNIKLEKKNLYINKMFSLSIEEANKLVNKYSKDIKNISLEDDIKEKFNLLEKTLKSIEEITNIDELYNSAKNEMNSSDILKLKNVLHF